MRLREIISEIQRTKSCSTYLQWNGNYRPDCGVGGKKGSRCGDRERSRGSGERKCSVK